jgi:hypothetical protein
VVEEVKVDDKPAVAFVVEVSASAVARRAVGGGVYYPVLLAEDTCAEIVVEETCFVVELVRMANLGEEA